MLERKTASSPSNKSTNVRANFALGLTRALVSAGSRYAPYETGGFLVSAFTRTHREVQRSVDVADVLVLADRFELEHAGTRVRGVTMRPEGEHPNAAGDGPHLLLVHGWDGGAHQMLPFVRPLVERGFVVSLVDLPAHGASDGERTTLRDMTDVITGLARSIGPFHGIVAHSVGAAAATLALIEGLPLERIVLVAPPISLESQARAFAASVGAEDASLRPMLATMSGLLRRPIDAASWLRDVESLTTEALVIHDRRDRIIPIGGSEELITHWRNARLVATEGLGHARILGAAVVIDEAVRFFGEARVAAEVSA